MKYNYLLEQFEFGWHLELQSIPPDLNLHLFVKHLVLHRHFLKPWPPENKNKIRVSMLKITQYNTITIPLHPLPI